MSDLIEVRNDILREMYSEATPPLDVDDVLDNPDDYPEDWYKQHTLPEDRQMEIFEKHCCENNITGRDKTELSVEAILNYGPATQEE